MIKSIVAVTREIDDEQAAVAEILQTLDLEKNLLTHSIGIISCFSEFDDTGVLQAVCDALPFDCVGATTCICAADKEIDQVILGITVLTSDDCAFKTTAIPIDAHYTDTIASDLSALLASSEEKPAFFFTYFPLINDISGDMMLQVIDEATGGIPLFGTAALDHLMDYSSAKTIHNGKAYRTALVMGAIYGTPQFKFEIAAIEESKIRKQKAIITESNGNLLIGVNGKTALEYLEEVGLTKNELEIGLGIIPLVVDNKDGTKPVARAVFAVTPEGYAVCGGAMPVNATLSIGRIDMDDVLRTTTNTLKPFVQNEGGIISYSCMARYLTLGVHSTAEAERVLEATQDAPCLFAYSGGEICPLPDADGVLKNFYHNYTVVFCSIC